MNDLDIVDNNMYALVYHLVAAGLLCCRAVQAQSLPQVDLGYEIHQAIELNVRYLQKGLLLYPN